MDGFEFLICSPVDKEKLTCEIYYRGDFLAEISQETDEFIIIIAACPKEKWRTFPLKTLQKVLEKGKKNLIGE